MVFSSVPIYLDPPNWQQQQPNQDHHQHQHQHHHNQNPNNSSNNNNFPPPPPALPAQPPSSGGGGGSGPGAGPAKPGSMAERARMAKIPQPETALKCPRCDSTNTKFCYYNNYSLTQPRHFCKTCRRYWTRGGALRTVPVGGGCRRNKRSKSSSSGKSKPSSSSSVAAATSSNSDRHNAATSSSANPDVFSHLPLPPPNFPFLPNLHHLGGSGEVQYGGDLGLSFSSSGGGGGDVDFLAEQWRINQQSQFPFMAGNILEAPMINGGGGGGGGNNNMIYPNFDSTNNSDALMSEGHNSHLSYVRPTSASSKAAELAAVKVEGINGGSSGNNGENQGVNMSRNFLGVLGNNYGDHHHYSLQLHGGNSNTASGNNIPWNTDLSSFTTTTSSNHTLI